MAFRRENIGEVPVIPEKTYPIIEVFGSNRYPVKGSISAGYVKFDGDDESRASNLGR